MGANLGQKKHHHILKFLWKLVISKHFGLDEIFFEFGDLIYIVIFRTEFQYEFHETVNEFVFLVAQQALFDPIGPELMLYQGDRGSLGSFLRFCDSCAIINTILYYWGEFW